MAQSGYPEKIQALGEAMMKGGKNTKPVSYETAMQIMDEPMQDIIGFQNDLIRLGWASDLAWGMDFRGQEYRDTLQPYHDRCYSSESKAADAMDRLNNMTDRYGLDPMFAQDTRGIGTVTEMTESFCTELCGEGSREMDQREHYWTKKRPMIYPEDHAAERAGRRLPDTPPTGDGAGDEPELQ